MSAGGEDREAWFPEPSHADASAARRGEHTTDWLKRSTHPRARAVRRFLNENLSALPSEHRSVLYRTLHEWWHSVFFELIVGRTLQTMGATIEAEPGGASDTRIDFVARFTDGTIAVEAVSPLFDAEVGETVRRRNPLLDIVESESPSDVWVMVSSLPNLGLQDSKKRFRSTVRRLLAGTGNVELPDDRRGGVAGGHGEPHVGEEECGGIPRKVGIVPALTSWDDTEQRVRRAVARKRRQGREAVGPART